MYLDNEQILMIRRRKYRGDIRMSSINSTLNYYNMQFTPNQGQTITIRNTINQYNIGVQQPYKINNGTDVSYTTNKKMHFTISDYLNAGEVKHTRQSISNINPQHYNNAVNLISKVNQIGDFINADTSLSSGYRTRERQMQIGREQGKDVALNSLHTTGHAVDIKDPYGQIKKQIRTNKQLLQKAKKLGLYFENFSETPGWVHIQDVAPGYCGNQIWSADNFLAALK